MNLNCRSCRTSIPRKKKGNHKQTNKQAALPATTICHYLQSIFTEKPPIAYHWKAHDRAIVSLNFVDHELQAMIITASTDKTARLWTLEGRFIGTFGQRKKWNLKQPTSYQYPK